MLHRAIASRITRLQLPLNAVSRSAGTLLPLLFEFSAIVAAGAVMGAGYALALAWDWLAELW
jgi:hypothetical protein